MLVLTRAVRESICINNQEIVITILGIRGNQVSVGVKAPPHISIHRKEIQERIYGERDYNMGPVNGGNESNDVFNNGNSKKRQKVDSE